MAECSPRGRDNATVPFGVVGLVAEVLGFHVAVEYESTNMVDCTHFGVVRQDSRFDGVLELRIAGVAVAAMLNYCPLREYQRCHQILLPVLLGRAPLCAGSSL